MPAPTTAARTALTTPTPAVPTPGMVLPLGAGLIFGEHSRGIVGLQSPWQDWSWGSTNTWTHASTTSGGGAADMQQVGPQGLQWVVTVGGDGNNALFLRNDNGFGTRDYGALVVWVKKPTTGEPLRFDLCGNTGASLGTPVTVSSFRSASLSMYPLCFTLRGPTLPGTAGNFNLPAGIDIYEIRVYSTGASTQTIYLDELQFLRLRPRSVPLVNGTRPEIRSAVVDVNSAINSVFNYAWPEGRPVAGAADKFWLNYFEDGLGRGRRIDGDCAGTTEEILEWAALKWFGDVNAAYQAASGPGTLADLAKAICPLESQWKQEACSDWELFNWHDGGASSSAYTLASWGIGQVKHSAWNCYPHSRISTAWSADCHMGVIRYHYDRLIGDTTASDSWLGAVTASIPIQLAIAVQAWQSGALLHDGTNRGELSYYACRVFGGTVADTRSWVTDNGLHFVGYLTNKSWQSTSNGSDIAWETGT